MQLYQSWRNFTFLKNHHLLLVMIGLLMNHFFLDIKPLHVFLILGGLILFETSFNLLVVWPYFSENKGKVYKINRGSLQIIEGEKCSNYTIEQIDKIIMYMARGNPKYSTPISSLDFFHYGQIILKSGEQIIITSLCGEDIEEALEGLGEVPIERKFEMPRLGKAKKQYPMAT